MCLDYIAGFAARTQSSVITCLCMCDMLGFAANSTIRTLGVPISQYIDDWYMVSRQPVPGPSPLSPILSEFAAYIARFILTRAEFPDRFRSPGFTSVSQRTLQPGREDDIFQLGRTQV